jgi:hypothetical protein
LSTAVLNLSNLARTFDGTPQAVTVTTTPAGLPGVAITYGGSATAPTNAGSYSVIASLTNANYTAPNATGTLAIAKGGSTTVVNVANANLDGLPHGATASVTGAGGLNQALSVVYAGTGSTVYPASSSAPVNAGTYSASATFAGDANHNGSSDTKNFSITQGVATLTQ